jgi:hypothetical protein
VTENQAENGEKARKRFSVDEADGWTECSCITDPCQHGDDRMRPYRAWTVWDNQKDEHAFITCPHAVVEPEYLRKREAQAVARRLNGAVVSGRNGAAQ